MVRRLILALLALLVATQVAPAAAEENLTLSVLVTTANGTPIPGASVTLAGDTSSTDTTDYVGRAEIRDGAPGEVVVAHPRFTPRTVEWDGTGDRLRVALGSPVLRALHVAGNLPGSTRWQELLNLADRTALNAVMLDMKDESGIVWPTFSGSAPAPAGFGRWDLSTVAAELHARDLALIVRVVAFQDPRFAAVAPHAAVLDLRTNRPFERRGQVFLDPSDPVGRAYVKELAAAACAAGVDEVQLDYIRFPDGMSPDLRFDNVDPTNAQARSDTITSVIAEIKEAWPSCVIAADIFGFVTSIDGDGGIGQDIEHMGAVTDVLSPMVYPNHWSRGWFGFDSPAANPGGVVTASMSNALDRAGDLATMRPWLQDFGGYGPAEVRAQIDAADALGLGWMIWNSRTEYQESALPTDAEVLTPDLPPPPTVEFLPASGFWDVPDSNGFSADIAWLGTEGITRGCNPPWRDEFCPRRGVSRAEAAAFIVRALDLPAATEDRFTDDDGTTHEADINALAAAGITRGCAPTRFCPNDLLSRAQMASLLARALDLPRSLDDRFRDDDGSTHEADIQRIAATGITRGCGPVTYCPHDPVTREQMAAFLHRALG